jgi:hypothetical protein
LHTRNWQTFTLKFWNTPPAHLFCPHRISNSFLTSETPQEKKVFKHSGGYISCRRVVCSTNKSISTNICRNLRTQQCRCSFYCALLTLHVSAPIGGHLQVVYNTKNSKAVTVYVNGGFYIY